jgi:hypothetical protein
VLVLLSVSFGLVAAELPFAVVVPAALGFAVGLVIARGIEGRRRT